MGSVAITSITIQYGNSALTPPETNGVLRLVRDTIKELAQSSLTVKSVVIEVDIGSTSPDAPITKKE